MRAMKKMSSLTLLALSLILPAGCMSYRESNTVRTPEEQILLSKAADYSLAKAVPAGLPGRKVYIDVSNLECPDKLYVTDAVRQILGEKGARVVERGNEAEVIVTVRAGMLATQSGTAMLGIPGFKLPLPITSGAIETPELAFFKRSIQEGFAKLSLTAYDNNTKAFLEAGEGTARTHFSRWHILFFVNYVTTNVPELKIPISLEK
jgi:hypothetical protein